MTDLREFPGRETPRLLLRQFTADDLDELAAIHADPEVMKYLGLRGAPLMREEAEMMLVSIISTWRNTGFGRWAAVDRVTRRLAGYAGFRPFGVRAELVYVLGRPYWGRGLATEAARECLRFASEEKLFDEVVAFTRVANLASRRVLEKIGMRYEGEAEFFSLLRDAGIKCAQAVAGLEIPVAYYSASLRVEAAQPRD
ncbi:MAG: GNAT family N-acetyltransferase [Acidobacteriota bacterium]|nr:GNAT family N-acetyltransferase [Acidobacteriota bacterium]